jgi:hypothetical protein
MANFLIEISYLHPYPVKKDFRQEATSIGTAINRAIRVWRKENGKGIKVKTINVRATKI